MANEKVVNKKRLAVENKTPLEYQEFLFVGKICKFSDSGIQIQKGRIKSWYWFNNDTGLDLQNEGFNIGDEVKMKVLFKTYINKDNEYTTRIFVKDIDKLDPQEAYMYEFNQPKCAINAQVVGVTKTDIKGLFILEAIRFDENNQEHEKYYIRYFNKNIACPDLGKYEIDFDLYNSSRIIQANGEIYTKEEEYTIDSVKKKKSVFIPYLEANAMYLLVTAKVS